MADYFQDKKFKENKPVKFPSYYSEKNDKFFLQYFQAMYSEYVKDKGSIPYSRRFDFNLYRLYGEGNQPTEKYMNILCPLPEGKTADSDREGWMNISWDIISVLPKFRRIFTGIFEKIEHDVVATSVNDKALAEKEDYKWNLWAQKELKPFFESLDAEAGIESSTPAWLPGNMQELEMFMSESFKLLNEMSMEMGIDYAFYLSGWPEIKKRMLEDAFDLGVFACQDYVDPVDRKIKIKYLDPAKLIMRYSRDKQFSNIDYWGYIDEMTIGELRVKSKFDEETIQKIAFGYAGFADNVVDFQWDDYYNLSSNNVNASNPMLPYDSFRVNVMFGEFITTNGKVVKIVKGADGARRSYIDKRVTDQEWTAATKENREVDSGRYQQTMKGYWVVGTEFVFECGPAYVVPRENKKNPKLSLNAYKYANKSLLASCIPNADSFQLAWLKLQNAKAMASPAGLMIEIGVLENISIGEKTLSPLDILTIRRATGDTLYKANTHHSEVNSPGAAHPLQETQGGIGNQLQEFIQCMEYDLNMIRAMTGINEAIDASSPKERTAVGTSEMAAAAANNNLQPIYSGYIAVKEAISKKMVSRYQTMAANGEIKGYLPALGSNVLQVFTLSKDVSAEEYAIKLRVRPTDEMKQAVRAAALAAEQLGPKQGGISHSDYLYIEDKIQDNNLKYARLYLNYKEKLYSDQAAKMQTDNMQMNGKNMQDAEAAKTQGALQIMAAQTQSAVTVERAKTEGALVLENARHENKIREIGLANQGKIANTIVGNHTAPAAVENKS